MKIQVIVASTRPGRVGERVGAWVMATAGQQEGMQVELVNLADYQLPFFNEAGSPQFTPNRQPEPEVKRWLEKLAEADGYVIVTAEYNHTLPGALKNALDYIDFQLSRKPVLIASYGVRGGVRAAENLKAVLNSLQAAAVPARVELADPTSLINEDGTLTEAARQLPYGGPQGALQGAFGELAWWTKTLKAGREALQEA
jgi:NAD(P)H-dependent FMN reductase